MSVTIRLRRDSSTNWTTINPILLLGEPGFETDTNKLKIGNGTDTWNNLPYVANDFLGNRYYTGPSVTVYKPNYGDVVDHIEDNLILTRGLWGPLYNTFSETEVNPSTSPSGTEWNVDGWDDFSDITERTYTTLNDVLAFSIIFG
jgi:hypothetical protein